MRINENKKRNVPENKLVQCISVFICAHLYLFGSRVKKTILAVAPGNTESAINVVKGVMSSLMARSSRCHRLKILTFLRAPLLAGEHQHFPGQV